MRRILWAIVLLPLSVMVFVIVSVYLPSGSPCEGPMHYTIGTIDDEFGISRAEFKQVVSEAERRWEKLAGRELFQFAPDAAFTVNLVFDERQEQTQARQEAREKVKRELERLREDRSDLMKEYERLTQQYQERKETFDSLTEQYRTDRDVLNERVREWNEMGTSSGHSRTALQQDKQDLADLRERIENVRADINRIIEERDKLVEKEGELVRQYNTAAETYTERYGEARRFEKGNQTKDRITIYQFKETSDLRLALVHEFGHALGIKHVSNPRSVMYHLMQEQSLQPIQFTKEDREALKKACEPAGLTDLF